MSDLPEKLQGVKEILTFLRWSEDKYQRYYKELRQENVIHIEYIGRPPRKTPCMFKKNVMFWIATKAARGQII